MLRILFIGIYIAMVFGPGHSQEYIEPPVIERITVLNTAGHVGIEWSYPSGADIDGFIIHRNDPNEYPSPGPSVDTIFSANTFSYIDLSGQANDSSIFYSVDAFRIDGDELKTSPQSEQHATMFAQAAFDSCQNRNIISWSKYLGWGNNDLHYRIYANSTEIGATSDTFYIHDDILYNENYRYYILGQTTEGKTTASNRTDVNTNYPEPPGFINADYATVTASNTIELSFSVPDTDESYQFKLVRTNPDSGIKDTLFTYSGGQQTLSFTDPDVDVLRQQEYVLLAINSCKEITATSNRATNIVLDGSRDDNVVSLSWTAYAVFQGSVEFYEVYRDLGNGPVKIGETQTTSFIDNTDNFDIDDPTGTIRYFVRAIEGVNPHGINGESNSNAIDIVMDIKIEFPTAFTPNGDGKNDYFRPINLSFVPESYQIIVFDRWGMPVFQSGNVNDQWNGTNGNGKPVMEGVYNFQVEFTTLDGKKHIQKGSIAVLYP